MFVLPENGLTQFHGEFKKYNFRYFSEYCVFYYEATLSMNTFLKRITL
jgi:hypothetical protein